MVYSVLSCYSKFYQLLEFYTFDEITQECKTIPLPQKAIAQRIIKPLDQHVSDVLAGIKTINSKDRYRNTALRLVCIDNQLPIIIELLKRGADLERHNDNRSAYLELQSSYKRKSLFVIREIFNNDHAAPILLLAGLSYDPNNSLTQTLLPEIIGLIKPLYVNEIKEDLFTTPEARMWKYVCVRACELAKINETDENRCLTKIMMLPRHKKTELNLLLLKEGK